MLAGASASSLYREESTNSRTHVVVRGFDSDRHYEDEFLAMMEDGGDDQMYHCPYHENNDDEHHDYNHANTTTNSPSTTPPFLRYRSSGNSSTSNRQDLERANHNDSHDNNRHDDDDDDDDHEENYPSPEQIESILAPLVHAIPIFDHHNQSLSPDSTSPLFVEGPYPFTYFGGDSPQHDNRKQQLHHHQRQRTSRLCWIFVVVVAFGLGSP